MCVCCIFLECRCFPHNHMLVFWGNEHSPMFTYRMFQGCGSLPMFRCWTFLGCGNWNAAWVGQSGVEDSQQLNLWRTRETYGCGGTLSPALDCMAHEMTCHFLISLVSSNKSLKCLLLLYYSNLSLKKNIKTDVNEKPFFMHILTSSVFKWSIFIWPLSTMNYALKFRQCTFPHRAVEPNLLTCPSINQSLLCHLHNDLIATLDLQHSLSLILAVHPDTLLFIYLLMLFSHLCHCWTIAHLPLSFPLVWFS